MTAAAANKSVERDPGPLDFLRAVRAERPRRLAECLTLVLLLGLTEWAGLMLLVPLLAFVGVRADEGAVGRLGALAAGALGRVGVRATLPAVLAVFVAVVAARALVQRREAEATTALEQEFTLALRRRLYHALVGARWTFFARHRASDFSHALTQEADRISAATAQLVRLTAELLLGLVYLAVALRVSFAMTALACACGGALLLALRGRNRRARESGEALGASYNELFAAVHEHLAGMKTARSYNAEWRNAEAFDALAGRVAGAYAGATRSYATSSALFAAGAAAVLGAFIYLAVAVLALPASAVLLLLLAFSRLVPRFSSALSGYQYFAGALPAYATVTRWIARCEAEAERRHEDVGPVALRRGVRLDEVRFRYRPELPAPTLDDVTLDIPAHQTTAVVGPSGAGKSTIADLVLGLVAPEAGAVTVDGVPLAVGRCRRWRDLIGYVPQDTFLLHDTVRANLLWAAPGADEAELHEALRQAAADGFVARLPEKLDTVIGDRGVLLSGGERQRLALARALLRRPALLVLDEATSALDSENERRIQQAIARLHGRLTILVITHRLSAVRDADLIHVVEGGRVVESGTWDALVTDDGGRFRALCAAQGIVAGDPAGDLSVGGLAVAGPERA